MAKVSPFLRDTNVSQCDLPERDRAVDEKWRRVTGMTLVQEPKMDLLERRAGIEALVERIKAEYLDGAVAGVMESEICSGAGGDGDFHASMRSEANPLTPRTNGCASALSPRGEGGGLSGNSDWQTRISAPLTDDPHGRDARATKGWASEGSTRQILNWVCRDYNISLHQLNLLAREYRGISASELIDGMRVKPVKAALAELLKVYARELWLTPGLYANVLASDAALKVFGCGASSFFVDPAEGWRRAELYETRAERLAALLAAFDEGWTRGELSRDGFAAKLGFRGFKELNRACLNVFGETVRQLAFGIIKEIVEFYLAAEVKALRELACCETASHNVMRARFLYGGDCEKPATPFFDLWETQDAAWLRVMGGWLGR